MKYTTTSEVDNLSNLGDRYFVSDAVEVIDGSQKGEVGQVLQVFYNENILAVNLPDYPNGCYLGFDEVRKL